MSNKISKVLDSIANSLECRGLIREALGVDKVSDEIDAMQHGDDRVIMLEKLVELTKPTVEDLKALGVGSLKEASNEQDVAVTLYKLHELKKPVAGIVNAFVERDLRKIGKGTSYEVMMLLKRLWSNIFNSMWEYFDSKGCPSYDQLIAPKIWSDRFKEIRLEVAKKLSPVLKNPFISSEIAKLTI